MVQAISSLPISTQYKSLEQEHPSLTDANIKQIALAFFSVILFIVGYKTFSIGTPIGVLIAAVCFTVVGTLMWLISKVKHYDDPVHLEKYQKEAITMTLHEIMEEHGLDNMIKYQIPLKRHLLKKFQNAITPM